MKKNPAKIRKTGSSDLPENRKASVCLSIISLVISAAGFLTGLYFWRYDKTSYADLTEIFYFFYIIYSFILLLYISIIYTIINLYKREQRRVYILSVLGAVFSAAAFLILSIDIIFLLF